MDKIKKKSANFGRLLLLLTLLILLGLAVYFGLPAYSKYKAKQDIERIGLAFSEQKFIEKACDGDDGSVALFIQAGMNINVLAVPTNGDRVSKSALHCAAETGNTSLAKSLLDLGADVNSKDDNGNTPLFSAAGRIRYISNRRNEVANNLEMVKLLLGRGADINAGGSVGTPLIAAVQSGSFEVFDFLIEKGADVKVKNKEDMTPIMLFAYSYNNKGKDAQSRVTTLIKGGVDVNATNKSGQTALMIAVNNRSKEMIRTLLENGADASIEDKNNSSILSYAMSDQETFKLLLDRGANPNFSASGQPLLHRAATSNDASLQLLLANKKTDVNIKNSSSGDSVLHVLARMPNPGYITKISMLVANGATVDATNNQLETPLIRAVQSYNIEAARVLLESKAKVNLRDASGRTALFYANQNIGRGAYAYSGASAYVAPPVPIVPSVTDSASVRDMMRSGDSAAIQRYIAELQRRNSPYPAKPKASTIKDPLVELLLRYGAAL